MSASFTAEYPGKNSTEAYQSAIEGRDNGDLPFSAEWVDISVTKFYDSVMAREAKGDDDLRDYFIENDWAWVATLKAGRG